ncbi:hypothetical protein NLG97_g6511 [Lecanicillium saksenae]|uniref:Uncharacterized protein n=1 Tax=Lecanicillium saksenae TaxID=468837 RepID=A0ACC1QPF2_9HYPO|nr:hypothetical protein NLG97_g6511 [Lecanicillium saksenae]
MPSVFDDLSQPEPGPSFNFPFARSATSATSSFDDPFDQQRSVFDEPHQSGPALGFANPFEHLDETGASGCGVPLHRRLLSKPAHEQLDCPLFKTFSSEIRVLIFSFALADYEDPDEDKQARKAKAALRRTLNRLKREHEAAAIKIFSLRVFSPMITLELCVPDFLEHFPDLYFRQLFIIIRHTDFWWWQDDAPLRFDGDWIPRVCRALPTTVREVIIEMETLKRKSGQLDDIANQMAQRWHFRTRDGKALFADCTPNSRQVSSWQGSSCRYSRRWIRDEVSKLTLEYHVVTVRFKPKHVVEQSGGKISEEALKAAEVKEFVSYPRMDLHLPEAKPMEWNNPCIRYKMRSPRNRRPRLEAIPELE